MRDYEKEIKNRVLFIKECMRNAGTDALVFANSGGKDCALVGILCKKACDNVTGVIMPCLAKRNFTEDKDDGMALDEQFGIETLIVDLSEVKTRLTDALAPSCEISKAASVNIAPRLRMTAIYAIAQSKNALVAGTGNKSERTMGYFTKWGDGAFDFNPIADLTATEVFEFLRYLKAPAHIIEKAPSAGLFEGQTDEQEMGLTYEALDKYIQTGTGDLNLAKKVETAKTRNAHKLTMPKIYEGKC